MFISFVWGVFVWGFFGKGGFCPGGFCLGVYVRGFCPGGFVLIPQRTRIEIWSLRMKGYIESNGYTIKMPHSNFKERSYPFNSGVLTCPCGQTFDFASERDMNIKL